MSEKSLVIGLLAHVDAGKTTLAEQLLYRAGVLREPGRVDHGNAFLDTDAQERARGITIFSKQARLVWRGMALTLLDTPGHVDFSAQMERTLQVLDCAVLIVNAADGVQSHTLTLWRLLARYQVPVFVFVNKMDQPGTEGEALLSGIRRELDGRCARFSGFRGKDGSAEAENRCGWAVAGAVDAAPMVDYIGQEAFYEEIALCDEELLTRYLERQERVSGQAALQGTSDPTSGGEQTSGQAISQPLISDGEIAHLVARRGLFPCYFGSALRGDGVEALLDGLFRFVEPPAYGPQFGARVFQITRDAQGTRLTHLKVTGGSLKVKQSLATGNCGGARTGAGKAGEAQTGAEKGGGMQAAAGKGSGAQDMAEEKVDQIRLYSGEKYEVVQEAAAGSVCALTGLVNTFCGQGLGAEEESVVPLLEPVMTYRMELPEGSDVHALYRELQKLQEEEPQLHLFWQAQTEEIHVRLMGQVQTETFGEMIRTRLGVKVRFSKGSVVYKETIAGVAEGVGHFEPLRHYAEVHLILEPGERGSGLTFHSRCSEDKLDRNWQRLILTHLEERSHPGVLTGAPVTDMHITLAAGRAHEKHTEGGDFRQATYRALRQGLCRAESVLLEPVYAFRLEMPRALAGRAMTDIQAMAGRIEGPELTGESAVLTGTVPAASFGDYQTKLAAYSGGRGRLFLSLHGYEPCHNAAEVIDRIGYEAEQDMENPCGSVFCAHGAGFLVPWDQVEEHMHLEPALRAGWRLQNGEVYGGAKEIDFDQEGQYGEDGGMEGFSARHARRRATAESAIDFISQDEVEEIFARTYGRIEAKRAGATKTIRAAEPSPEKAAKYRGQKRKTKECLLVDGYNIIFAWDELRKLAEGDLGGARERLVEILSNFQAYRGMRLILVFDAYRVKGGSGRVERRTDIDVVYTKEAETADQYIEKVAREIDRKDCLVRVATSDALEQVIIMGAGAIRLSAAGLLEEVRAAQREMEAYC